LWSGSGQCGRAAVEDRSQQLECGDTLEQGTSIAIPHSQGRLPYYRTSPVAGPRWIGQLVFASRMGHHGGFDAGWRLPSSVGNRAHCSLSGGCGDIFARLHVKEQAGPRGDGVLTCALCAWRAGYTRAQHRDLPRLRGANSEAHGVHPHLLHVVTHAGAPPYSGAKPEVRVASPLVTAPRVAGDGGPRTSSAAGPRGHGKLTCYFRVRRATCAC
jgi:hypothetical protein